MKRREVSCILYVNSLVGGECDCDETAVMFSSDVFRFRPDRAVLIPERREQPFRQLSLGPPP